jgi:pilus assembly protein FimV
VRSGQVLNLPTADSMSAVDIEDADRLVQSHHGEWEEYRGRLAARPTQADAASGQRAVTGKIEAKPEVPPPGASQEQLRLAKADPVKPSASQSRAARADDATARERALKEAQSRVTDLEKNVADLSKLLEMKNQQLAELEKKASAKPAPVAPAPATAPAKPEAAKSAPPVPEALKPASVVPVPEAKKAEPAPAPEAKKAEAPKPKPKAAPPPAPPPPSLLDEFLDNPIALAGLGFILALLIGYGLWAWRRKKTTHAKFQDSVLGAAAGGAAFSETEAAAASGASQASVNQPVAGMEAEEVDPIAEADVYMAYGRDAQAEEILKEALQKDATRIPVHAKLLEIYAKRQDTKAFEQTALKMKELTQGSGPQWEKTVTLGRSIDPGNGLYGGRGGAGIAAAAGAAAGVAAAAPAVDFDIGGGTTPGFDTPDIELDDQPKTRTASSLSSIDFDLGAATTPPADQTDFTPEGTLKLDRPASDPMASSGLDFDLNLGGDDDKPLPPPTPIAAAPAEANDGLDFDLNLDLDGDKPADQEQTAAPMDLSAISLDLGSAGEPSGASSNDPKWQEVATKLDLAKAYDEMGDKDGARELLNEVMQDGDAAQKGQAEHLLTKLG